ncbi:hypothetical protein VE03_07716 [Pseudogymnoascus sp. 23342-1-I1]|nr:hypothetical protein VE03_07716 [Pseudogymnoascus sp. 23342-1-I1]
MPSKIQLDENLWFLYICLQKSDYKNIDFGAVGAVTNLKSPAARMRYTRLRRQIEGGTLIGTHGTPFQRAGGGGGEEGGGKKRKRGGRGGGDEGDDDEGGGEGEVAKRGGKWTEDGYESDTAVEPDNEAPLAKRTARLQAAGGILGTARDSDQRITPQTGHSPLSTVVQRPAHEKDDGSDSAGSESRGG